MSGSKGVRRWPLGLIAAPAAVAVWSGWVGLGEMSGFGIVKPLPGLPGALGRVHLNTAISLPVGVEAYAAFALGAWLAPVVITEAARRFARASSVGALVLGMLGQVAYHLLTADHARRARCRSSCSCPACRSSCSGSARRLPTCCAVRQKKLLP
ncbi:MAG TPA: hypothetical protein VMU94_09435 [Streptosporangiaceae bacterium]|nr:hypothetical protein [Streptosporangiaceae bacterium]